MPGADRGAIAFVVPRYGPRVVGGAETLCRLVAEDLAGAGVPVEVFTTCALDHFTWADALPPGTTVENGVPVHRFPVDPRRDPGRFAEIHHSIARTGGAPMVDQLEWMAHSVTSPALLVGLRARARDIRIRLALPYLFGTTYWSVVDDPAVTALIPCLHDEPYAELEIVTGMLEAAAGCLANAPAEDRLIGRLAPRARTAPGGVGFHVPDAPADPEGFCAERGIAPGYILYAGRREEAKGVPLLYECYRVLRERRPDTPPLALMGSGDLPVPAVIAEHVVDLGFVPADRMRDAMAGAAFLAHPSRLESFGMVMLEAWLERVPALVNAGCEVLVDHCRDSGGGLWFADVDEFTEAAGVMLDDPPLRDRMGDAGRAYVAERHSWTAVRSRYLAAVEEWA